MKSLISLEGFWRRKKLPCYLSKFSCHHISNAADIGNVFDGDRGAGRDWGDDVRFDDDTDRCEESIGCHGLYDIGLDGENETGDDLEDQWWRDEDIIEEGILDVGDRCRGDQMDGVGCQTQSSVSRSSVESRLLFWILEIISIAGEDPDEAAKEKEGKTDEGGKKGEND